MPNFHEFTDQKDLWAFASEFLEGMDVVGVSGGSAGQIVGHIEGVEWFLIDERKVPYDSNESNCRALRSDTTDKVHCMIYDDDFLEALPERLQAILMGIGSDGHIASLFPGTDFDDDSVVIESFAEGYETEERISLSMNYLLKSDRVLFVLIGERKKDLWDKLKNNQMSGSPIGYFMENFDGEITFAFAE